MQTQLDGNKFNEMVEQKLEPNMVTNFKTNFEIAEEKAELKGIEKGIVEGEMYKAKTAILNMLKLKIFTLEQIASVLEVDIDFVKKIQNEWLLSSGK
ncbi:MAG: hypothetical protein JNL70_18060 [Saprospiraceae bacterium]|nr:hypothetical protein [Saprospiraceae bacterium]